MYLKQSRIFVCIFSNNVTVQHGNKVINYSSQTLPSDTRLFSGVFGQVLF